MSHSLSEIAEVRKLLQPRFNFSVMMIGAKQLPQANQAATLQDWKAQGLSACDGAPERFFRSGWSLGLFQNQRSYPAKFGFKPEEAAGGDQIHCPCAGGFRGLKISLLPSDVRQKSQKSGKRQAKLNRIENLNSTLNALRGLLELTLLSQSPTQEAIPMSAKGGQSMLFGQSQQPFGFAYEIFARIAQPEYPTSNVGQRDRR